MSIRFRDYNKNTHLKNECWEMIRLPFGGSVTLKRGHFSEKNLPWNPRKGDLEDVGIPFSSGLSAIFLRA